MCKMLWAVLLTLLTYGVMALVASTLAIQASDAVRDGHALARSWYVGLVILVGFGGLLARRYRRDLARSRERDDLK